MEAAGRFAAPGRTGPGPGAWPRPVDLEAMLAARDRREARQERAMARFGAPVVSLTLVTPGPFKDFPAARSLFHRALAVLDGRLRERGWAVPLALAGFPPTGPEALRAVAAPPAALKAVVADLEDHHPLGRLWDLDVVDPRLGHLSRSGLGLPPRRCLVCDRPAHACARSRAHPLAELQAAVAELLHAGGVRP